MNKKPKISKNAIRDELWHRGQLSWLLDINQKELYELYYHSEHRVHTWLLARRCLAEGSLIKTPNGLIPIQDLKPGDEVFGYNKDGSISISKVLTLYDNGEKEVVDLCTGSRVLETCTLDHKWLTVNKYDGKKLERTTESIKKSNPIVREYIDWKYLKGIHEPHAYAIGALLGDGCSKQGTNKIHISSENDIIPKHVANILNAKYVYTCGNNYTWILSHVDNFGKSHKSKSSPVECNYYNEWCRDRYAHEKIADLTVIKSWNVESQLSFLAGVLDTDGSVFKTPDNCLSICLGMQSKSVVEACQYIILNLFQHKCTLLIDNRSKYKNGPIYQIKIKNNNVSKRILKALSSYSVCERKKWKPEYEYLNENNSNIKFSGIKLKNPRIMKTYDIAIDNETNLYLTANGLVTHNSGKSFSLCTLAIETCLRNPNIIVKFLAPTRVQVNMIIKPIMRKILETCPSDIMPEYRAKDNIYFFPNGSEIQLAGTDGGSAERIRGTDADLAIIDEAGSCTDLDYIVKDIILPATLITKGRIILASTPPEDTEHDFIRFIEEAEAKGTLVIKTIDDNPRVGQKEKDELLAELGGKESDSAKRELYCQILKSTTKSVVPEFTKQKEAEIVKTWDMPNFYYPYVSMDVGFKDWTVVLFGYHDFLSNKLIIAKELVYKTGELDLQQLGWKIYEIEQRLFVNKLTNEVIPVKNRVSDNDLIVIDTVLKTTNYLMRFTPVKKDNKHAALNHLRALVKNEQIIIDPECKILIRHLSNVKWATATNKDTFARCPEGSHYDSVDALSYMIKSIDFNLNPYPKGHNLTTNREDVYMVKKPEVENANVYRKLLNLKR